MTIQILFFIVTLLHGPTKISARHHLRGLIKQYELQETSVFDTAYTEHGYDDGKEDLDMNVEQSIEQIRHSDGPSVITIDEKPGNISDDGAKYIVKFKDDSSDYVSRMQRAHVESNRDAYSIFGYTSVEFGNFIPKDKVEVMNIAPDKLRHWEERQDVEYVELGKI